MSKDTLVTHRWHFCANIADLPYHVKVPGRLSYPVLIPSVPDHYPLILHPIRYFIVIQIILGGFGLLCLVIFHTSIVLEPDPVAGDGLTPIQYHKENWILKR